MSTIEPIVQIYSFPVYLGVLRHPPELSLITSRRFENGADHIFASKASPVSGLRAAAPHLGPTGRYPMIVELHPTIKGYIAAD